MSVIIVYQSRHGCTEKGAWMLQENINEDIILHDMTKSKKVDIQKADAVILGASIHAGRIQKRMRKFMDSHMEELLTKPLGLYMCCMEKGENAEKQFNENFPEKLRDHASAKGLFGGEFNMDKMNFLEKAMVKKVANVTSNASSFNEHNVKQFATDITTALKSV
jgi:menaquinone-dependent protoporphyrinogen oxidase